MECLSAILAFTYLLACNLCCSKAGRKIAAEEDIQLQSKIQGNDTKRSFVQGAVMEAEADESTESYQRD